MDAQIGILAPAVVAQLERLGFEEVDRDLDPYRGRMPWSGYFGLDEIPVEYKVWIQRIRWGALLVPEDEDDDSFWRVDFSDRLGWADLKTYACSKERPYVVVGADDGYFLAFATDDEQPADPEVFLIDWHDFKTPEARSVGRLSAFLKRFIRLDAAGDRD